MLHARVYLLVDYKKEKYAKETLIKPFCFLEMFVSPLCTKNITLHPAIGICTDS